MSRPKGNRSWIFIRRSDAKAETPILWPPGVMNWLLRKDPNVGKVWRQKEKGTTEDEMVGWHHWLNGHEFEQAPEVGNGQGSLACCSPWGLKESDTTEWLNWTQLATGSLLKLLVLPLHPLPPMCRDPGSLPCVRKPFSYFFIHFFCDAYSIQFLYNALFYYNRICSL